jgi:Na+-transporting NADH:ubiquinone oxidoreductase subunit NqrC
MKNPLNWLKGAALVALTVLCLALTYRVVTAPALPDLKPTVAKLDASLDKINGKYGTISELNEAIVRTKDLITLTQATERKEGQMLDMWNGQISTAMGDVHAVMLATAKTVASIQPVAEQATSTLKTTQETVKALQEPISQATATLKAAQDAIEAGKRATETLQTAMVHVDALVTDPAIPATLASVQGTAADVQHVVHKFAFPGIWSKIKGLSLDVAHVFNPL